MGYCADNYEVDFRIPADKAGAALAAINAEPRLAPRCWHRSHTVVTIPAPDAADHVCRADRPFTTLADAVEDNTGFHDCEVGLDGEFALGCHLDKWTDTTEMVLKVLAPFAVEGSCVRMIGEDQTLFGYRVVEGRLVDESATVTWDIAPWEEKS